MEFKKYIQISTSVFLILSIIVLILAGIVWSKNIYTGILYLVIGLTQLIATLLLFPRIGKTKDITELGNIAVVHNWAVLSIGIAGCFVVLAPFFKVNSMVVIPYVAFAICLIFALLGIFDIYKAIKDTKASMVV